MQQLVFLILLLFYPTFNQADLYKSQPNCKKLQDGRAKNSQNIVCFLLNFMVVKPMVVFPTNVKLKMRHSGQNEAKFIKT